MSVKSIKVKIHTLHTFSISQMSELLDSGNIHLLVISGFVINTKLKTEYSKFMTSYNELFSGKEIIKYQEEMLQKLYYFNKINMLELLYYGLQFSLTKEYVADFKEIFRTEPKSISDLGRIEKEIKRYDGLLSDVSSAKKKTDEKEVKFAESIAAVESVLEYAIDRNISVYQFKFQYDLALKKIREITNKTNRHGKKR